MNKEDKEFIKNLKTQCKGAREIFKDSCCQLPISYIERIIEIEEEQEKEIEILKAIINKEHENNLDKRYVELKFISKDKIREKIKELSKTQAYKVGLEEYTIKILKELLEE